MESIRSFIISFSFLLLLAIYKTYGEMVPETKLMNKLLQDYCTSSRPIKNVHGNITVKIGLTLLHIVEVNERSQSFTISAWLYENWKDDLLQWNPENHDNISGIRIPTRKIWYPDIGNYNSIDRGYLDFAEDSKALAIFNGTVLHIPQVILKSRCQLKVTWFPFDEQKCHIELGSWTYSSKELDLCVLTEVDLSSFTPNGEWDLIRCTGKVKEKLYDETYSLVLYEFHLKRRSLYYFFNLIIPSGLIGFLALIGFTLPPESGEKLTLGVTVLFSLIMFLNVISQTCPSNSDSIPLLGTYFACIMFMIALSVVSTIFINLNRRAAFGNQQRNLSGFWEKLLLKWLPFILWMNPMPSTKTIDSTTLTKSDIHKTFNQISNINNNEISTRWLHAAMAIDRLCFMISVIFAMVSISVLMFSSQ